MFHPLSSLQISVSLFFSTIWNQGNKGGGGGGRGSALTFMCDHVAKSIKSYFRVGTLGRNAEHEQLSSHVQLGAFSFYLKGVYLLAPVSFRSNRRILSGELSYNYKGILRIKT